MVGEGEGGEHQICFGEESGDSGGGEGVRDEEITVVFVGSELLGCELCRYEWAFRRRRRHA